MSAARKGVIKWTPASVLRSVPFILLGLTAACSDGGSSPSFVDDGFKRHGELSISPNQLSVREGDSVAVKTSLVGGSSFDPSKVSWTVQPTRAGVVRGGYFVAEYYGDVTLSAAYSGTTATASAHVLPAPRAIAPLGADFVAGTAGRALPDSVSIKVSGRDGVAVPDVDVLFQISAGGGTLSTAQARTDQYGVARVKWTLGAGAGRNTLRALIPDVGEVRVEAQGYADLESATVELLGGGGQEGLVGEVLAEPVVVRVSDANGNPIRGVTIEWAFQGGEGSETGTFSGVPAVASITRAVTDVGGVSQMYWRLGTLAGDQTGSASIVAAAAAPGGNGKGGGQGKKDFGAHGKPGSLTDVTVAPDPTSLAVDEQTTLEAMPTDKWGNVVTASVTWSVSDANIATVDANGVVQGVLPGDVDVTAVADNTVSGTASVTVLPGAPASIEQTGSGQTGTVGQKLTDPLTARVFDQYGVALSDVTVTWSVASGGGSLSSQTTVTDANGLASAQWTLGSTVGAQSATATVQGVSPVTYDATAEEAPAAPSVASITVSPDPLTLILGAGHSTMTATAKDASGSTLAATFTWTSSDPSIATVTSNGDVMPLAIGQAEIRATADGVTGTATVLVQVDSTTSGGGGTDGSGATVGSVQASADSLKFTALGSTRSLSAIALDLTGNPLSGISFSWSSTNTAVATVDGNGNVLSKSVGTAAIVVNAICCNAADTVDITVTQVATSIAVTPASLSLQVGNSQQLTAVVKDSNGSPVPGVSVTWSSTDPSVGSVSSSGLAQALAAGSVAFEARSASLMGAAQATFSETTTGGGGTGGTSGGAFFSDGFETGDLSFSEGGFEWTSTVNVTVTSENPHTGSRSMRFRYKGSTLGNDAFAEARFNLPPSQELWFEYYIYFPDGTEGLGSAAYAHRDDTPNNNKFWKIAEKDSGASITALLEGRPASTNGWITKARPMWGNPADGEPSYERGLSASEGTVTAADLGTWVHYQFHIKVSDAGQSNGAWQMWKNGRLIVNGTGLNNAPSDSSRNKYLGGYLMGWSNSGFDAETYIWIDDVQFYNTNPGW